MIYKTELENYFLKLKIYLQNSIDIEDDINAKQEINSFLLEIKNFEKENILLVDIEELKKHEVDLEIKYDSLQELANYFDPVYLETKKLKKAYQVRMIRENNKKKREGM